MKWNRQREGRADRGHAHDERADEASIFFGESGDRKRRNRAMQLCRQVQRVVACTLSGQCADEVLQDLAVDSVVPAPDAGRLMVNVYPMTMAGKARASEILQRLSAVDGFLRREVARAIVRKRAPELVFNVIAMGGDHE